MDNVDTELIERAYLAQSKAYAPYSKFLVGAAARLENETICEGNNQENAAYPSGLCAERVALFAAHAIHPGTGVKRIAIIADMSKEVNEPVSPCGSCRQVMKEYEDIQSFPMEVYLLDQHGRLAVFNKASDFLPLGFGPANLI